MGFFSKLFRRLPPIKKFKDGDNVNKPEPRGTHNRRGAQVETFLDLPTLSHSKAYDIIYENDACFIPIQKRGWKCGAFDISIEGGGERGNALNTVVQQTLGIHAALEYLSYAVTEGARGMWLKAKPHGRVNLVDMRACGLKRIQAGGNLWWDGYDGGNVVRFAPINTIVSNDDDSRVARDRVLMFSPTVDSNPNGDTRQAQNLLTIANLAALLAIAEHVYTERFSIPKEIIKRVLDDMNPDDVSNAFSLAVDELEDTNAMKNMVLDNKEMLEIVEAKGATWNFLTELRLSLNGRAHKIVTGENMSSDSSGSGDTGSSDLADKQIFSVASYIMTQMAEPFTYEFLPFAERINDYWLPAAKKKDTPMRIVFKPPIEKQRRTIPETLGIIDRFYPMTYGELSRSFACEVAPGHQADEIFIKPGVPMDAEDQAKADEALMPSSTGEGEQRKDRAVPGSGMPAKNKKNKNDRRNIDKDEEESDDE